MMQTDVLKNALVQLVSLQTFYSLSRANLLSILDNRLAVPKICVSNI